MCTHHSRLIKPTKHNPPPTYSHLGSLRPRFPATQRHGYCWAVRRPSTFGLWTSTDVNAPALQKKGCLVPWCTARLCRQDLARPARELLVNPAATLLRALLLPTPLRAPPIQAAYGCLTPYTTAAHAIPMVWQPTAAYGLWQPEPLTNPLWLPTAA